MNLISILIALTIEHYYSAIQSMRRYEWFHNYAAAVYKKLGVQGWRNGPLGVVFIIGSVLIALWLVSAMLAGVADVFSFLFATVIVIYTMDPVDLSKQVHEFIDAVHDKDEEKSKQVAQRIIGCEKSELSALSFNAMGQLVQRSILTEAITRVLGVILWFMLLGPLGAAFFRMACEQQKHQSVMDDGYSKSINDLVEILCWLPVRFAVIGFALAGSFTDTVSRWTSLADFWKDKNEQLLIDSARGAIQNEPAEDAEDNACLEAIQQTLALVKRTLIVWLAAIAILTLTGSVF